MAGIRMRPPCELVVKYVLPTYRSLIAKELIETYKYSQVAAAKELGTTQAAISQYVYSKRGDKRIKLLESVPVIKSSAKKLAKGIANKETTPTEAMVEFCRLCVALRKHRVICKLHRELLTLPSICDLCPPRSRQKRKV